MQQFASIDEWNDLYARRQNVIIQFPHFFVEAFQGLLRIGTLAQESNARDDVVVVNNPSIFAVNRPGELAQANLWSLRDEGDVPHANRRAAFGQDNRALDVLHSSDEAHLAHVDLLQTGLDEAAAGIHVVVRELLLDLRQAQAISDQFIGINTHLILACRPAETGHVHNIRNGFQILFDYPVLDGLKLHDVVLRIAAAQSEKIDLPNRAPVRAHAWQHARRQRNLGEPLQNPLAVLEVVFVVIEDELQVGEPEQRERAEMRYVRNPVHHDFQRNGHLLLDLLRRNSRPLCDDLDIVVRNVWVRFDGKLMERNCAPHKQHQRQRKNKEPVLQGEID